MLTTLSTAALERLLDQFSVPMFALERDGPDADFRVTCLNTAMEDLSGLKRAEMIGQSIIEMAAAADEVMAHYQRCVNTRQTIRFSFLFTRARQRMYWDKTLQYAPSPEGHDRVIATALKPSHEAPQIQDQLAFEDLKYYATIADLQVENLTNGFDSTMEEARIGSVDEDRIMRLHAVCRTIQSTVADIKDVVRNAQARHAAQQRTDLEREQRGSATKAHGMDTVIALSDVSRGVKYQSGP